MATETNYDSMFGRMALEQGLCTDDELKRAFEQLKSEGQINPTTLHELMVELGFITTTQADRLHKSIKESKAAVHQIPGYKIEGKLGAGAMAIVYKAKQLSLNRAVAIKVLPKRFTQNPEYVERFYKEGQAAGKLNHPNIVQAVDVGEAGGYHYFVMEYVEGKTIYEELAAGKIYTEQEALDIVIQVAHQELIPGRVFGHDDVIIGRESGVGDDILIAQFLCVFGIVENGIFRIVLLTISLGFYPVNFFCL